MSEIVETAIFTMRILIIPPKSIRIYDSHKNAALSRKNERPTRVKYVYDSHKNAALSRKNERPTWGKICI